jgi:plastocyanin
VPGLAQAKTKVVNMGLPAPSKACDKGGTSATCKIGAVGADVNDFFPHGVTIHKGDKVKFLPTGFHSFDFPARGGTQTPLISPTGEKVAGVNDEANQPFWFNGQDQLSFTPSLFPPGLFGKKVSFNGSKSLVSGLPLGDGLKPITVTFKKKGKFTYFCNIHAGMKGTVSVKAKTAKIPSRKADKKALKRQLKRSLTAVQSLPKATPPANTVDVGVAGKHGEELFAFVPSALTVAPGTTLNFRMSPGSYDVHTATTGPGNPETEPDSYLGKVAAGFNNVPFDPRAVYPSETPGSPAATLTQGFHGNGFWNSGGLDTDNGTPLPSSNSVTFGAPGKYEFYCMVHPFMHATVTVQ